MEIIKLEDLPVLTKPVDIFPEDRLAISHYYNESLRGSTTATANAFVNGVLFGLVKAIGNRRYHGEDEPGDLLGSDGDLYFEFSGNTITSIYVKYNGNWEKL